uniref:Uncharacterized protein n=1 Tax=Pseudomonas phage RVTF4 TaxID=3236931 RepID=A0AB39CCK4_9VIRU
MWGIIAIGILIIFVFGVLLAFLGFDMWKDSRTPIGKLVATLVLLCGALVLWLDGAAVQLIFENLK